MFKLIHTKKKIWWIVLIFFSPIFLFLLFVALMIGYCYFNFLYIGSKMHIEYASQVQFPNYEIINDVTKDYSLANVVNTHINKYDETFEAILDSTQSEEFYRELDELIHFNKKFDSNQTTNTIWYDNLKGIYYFQHSPPSLHDERMYIDIHKKTGRMIVRYFKF